MGTAGAVALTATAVAIAAPAMIPGPDGFQQNLKLNSKQGAFFDVYQPPDQYNDNCALGDLGGAIADDRGFSPGNDASGPNGGAGDTFDGGLVLWVKGKNGRSPFEDSDSTGNLKGRRIVVGAEQVRGLVVKRIERAMKNTPTLRSLIKLKNPGGQALVRTLIWDSDLGTDGSEVVLLSSDGDRKLEDDDRWIVFADDRENPGDDIGTLGLYGRGGSVTPTQVFNPLKPKDGCISFKVRVRIPANGVRYLLFFTQSNDDKPPARKRARKLNDPGGELVDGLSGNIRSKIVNWDL